MDLTPDEEKLLISRASYAKSNGFAGVFLKFHQHRISVLRVELDESQDSLKAMYKLALTTSAQAC